MSTYYCIVTSVSKSNSKFKSRKTNGRLCIGKYRIALIWPKYHTHVRRGFVTADTHTCTPTCTYTTPLPPTPRRGDQSFPHVSGDSRCKIGCQPELDLYFHLRCRNGKFPSAHTGPELGIWGLRFCSVLPKVTSVSI